ncbi:MAG: superinfection immunity protein [Marinomonas sp.]
MSLSIWQLLIIVIALAFNFIPFVVASRRRHKQKWLVLVVSFLTFVGWIAALVWAINGETEEDNSSSVETFA